MPASRLAMTYRDADPTDVIDLVELINSAYRGESSRGGWTTEADLLGGIRTDAADVHTIVDDPRSRMLLANVDGRLIGCCHLQRRPEHVAYFGMFAIRPGLQGSGTGRAMLAEAESRVRRDWGATTMRMSVIAQRTELIDWYRRHGYHPTGETEPFPYGESRFGRPKRDDLYFVTLRKELGRDEG